MIDSSSSSSLSSSALILESCGYSSSFDVRKEDFFRIPSFLTFSEISINSLEEMLEEDNIKMLIQWKEEIGALCGEYAQMESAIFSLGREQDKKTLMTCFNNLNHYLN